MEGAGAARCYYRIMRGRWLLLASALVLAAVAGGAISLLRRNTVAPGTPTVTAGAREEAARELSLLGTVQARHVVPVGVAVTGTIEAFLAEVGQDVFEGQLLARIGNQSLEAAREEAARSAQSTQEKVNAIESKIIAGRLEASRARADANRSRDQFGQAEKVYLRQQMLHREGATPRLVYEKSEREFETARAEFTSLEELARQADDRVAAAVRDLETAKRALNERNGELENAASQSAGAEIRSPVSGILVSRKAEVGKMVGPEEAKDLFEIAVDLGQLAVVVQPDPAARARVRPGQDALLYVADLPGAIPGRVAPGDVASKAGDVIVEFSSPSAVIRPGMTAQVRLTLE
jgi:HlyD family secretion protein